MAEIDVTKSVQWLADNLGRNDLVVIDGSWHLPPENRDPQAEYDAQHIEGALFFDLDKHSDQDSDLPHTMPNAEQFAREMGELGIKHTDTLVVYDSVGLFSAARIWWMFRHFGMKDVFVLDGGLPAWKRTGLPLSSAPVQRIPASFRATVENDRIVDLETVRKGLEANDSPLIMDARGLGRFHAREPEPRAGMRSGHIPGAVNMHYQGLLDDANCLLPTHALKTKFEAAGFDPDEPTITSCGSGVTACIILMALTSLGHDKALLYDGSWSDWGGRADTPIET
ncbi:MAG: 3-mercaptopyruvate sulfurtransferase [Hyphomicrobiales bacterium]